jgi:hypothetical protein
MEGVDTQIDEQNKTDLPWMQLVAAGRGVLSQRRQQVSTNFVDSLHQDGPIDGRMDPKRFRDDLNLTDLN